MTALNDRFEWANAHLTVYANITLTNLYIILNAGHSNLLIPSTSTIPILQQCYLASSFVLFVYSFGAWRKFIKEPSRAYSS